MLLGCGATERTSAVEPLFPAHAPTLRRAEPRLPADCDELEARARSDEHDASLLAAMCPHTPLTEVTARMLLRSVDTFDAARRRLEQLRPFDELSALAQLVAHVEATTAVAHHLPVVASASVTPLDDVVLATAQLARAQVVEPGLGHNARTAARGYLAKVHIHALRQLGLERTRAPAPFERLLAALAIHYGRTFCDAYLRRRVAGLWPVCAEAEHTILEAVLALESDSGTGDVPIVVLEWYQGRRYLARGDVRSRLRQQSERAVDRLAPIVAELPRLVEHGFVDLAIARAATLQRKGNLRQEAVATLLRATLEHAEATEYLERLHARLARGLRRSGRAEWGSLDHARDPTWPTASVVARQQLEAIESADSAFARQYARGRAVLMFRERPDALRVALDRAARATDPAIAASVQLLRAVLDERDDGRLANLRLQTTTEAFLPAEPEAARRQATAYTARAAGDVPR